VPKQDVEQVGHAVANALSEVSSAALEGPIHKEAQNTRAEDPLGVRVRGAAVLRRPSESFRLVHRLRPLKSGHGRINARDSLLIRRDQPNRRSSQRGERTGTE